MLKVIYSLVLRLFLKAFFEITLRLFICVENLEAAGHFFAWVANTIADTLAY